ncbi:hypothetical protein EG68_03470 [Paragonimus skrjabini miyazakii]|uniref:Uncharacterized protein n=1 Tax=Paragonimus skrjabini miyazakii TaxID=59628 RepID=A0A8S9Z1N9_9TREM|nr:hypothetical protein EG68_03470 [Paragonimus skrjabini miyazakii]
MHFNEKRIVLSPPPNRHNLRRSSSGNLHIKDSLCYWLTGYSFRLHVCMWSAVEMNETTYYILIATVIIAGILIGCFGFLFLIVCLPWRRCCSCCPKSPDSHQRELEVIQQLSPPPYYECWVEELPPAYKDVQLVRTEACSSNFSQEHVHSSIAYRQNETCTPTSLPPEYRSTQSIRDMENPDAV